MKAKDIIEKYIKKSMQNKARVIVIKPKIRIKGNFFRVYPDEELPKGYDIVVDFENKDI